jgi:hypothetical protein
MGPTGESSRTGAGQPSLAALSRSGGYSLGLGANSEAWMRSCAAERGIPTPPAAPRGLPLTSRIFPGKTWGKYRES